MDLVAFAWLCAVLAAFGYAAEQLGGRAWVAMAIGAACALALVAEGSYPAPFDRGTGLVTANRAAGLALYTGAAVLGWILGRRRAKRHRPDRGA